MSEEPEVEKSILALMSYVSGVMCIAFFLYAMRVDSGLAKFGLFILGIACCVPTLMQFIKVLGSGESLKWYLSPIIYMPLLLLLIFMFFK